MKVERGFRLLIILGLFFFNIHDINAQQITPEVAKKVAGNWLQSLTSLSNTNTLMKAVAPNSIKEEPFEIRGTNELNDSEVLAYVFEMQPAGFIILSSNANINPIIAYSLGAKFDSTPSNHNTLLNLLKVDMQNRMKLVKENVNIGVDNQIKWEQLSIDTFLATAAVWDIDIGPLLSVTWGQGSIGSDNVFNYYTPNNWISGCVSTAAAQLLKYYNWPIKGSASHSYVENDAGTLTADFGSTSYDWNNMLDSYLSGSTQIQREAVGLLISDLGISVDMNYSAGSSSAGTPNIAKSYNNYFRTSGEWLASSESNFNEEFYSNITNEKPLIMDIRDSAQDAGHAVVVDGVQHNTGGTKYYHINFGWNGSSDAWYDLTNISTGSYNWDTISGAVLNVTPNPMFSSLSNTSSTGNYTVSWDVSSNLNADYFELMEGEQSASVSTFQDGAESGSGNWSIDSNWDATTTKYNTGSKSFRGYITEANAWDDQILTLNSSFFINSSTTITFNWATDYFDGAKAYLQVSTDGIEWNTLSSYLKAADTAWRTEDSIDLTDYRNKMVLIRFLIQYQGGSFFDGSTYNHIGFFVDDFSVTNSNEVTWSSYASNINTNSTLISGKLNGTNYYKARAFRDSQWWEWSNITSTATSISFMVQDSIALVALYDSTDGANWTTNTGWVDPTNNNVSTWHGVTVSGGRVTEVDLNANNLVGTIPTDIGNLTSLTNLVLNGNQLTGNIPTEIFNLSNLTYLHLGENQLSGIISADISNLSNLSYLYLANNQLTGSIPVELGNMTSLTSIFFYSNQLTGSIPPELGNLTNLTYLWLFTNQLTGSIPSEFGNFTNLVELNLKENQLTGSIPIELASLSNLSVLDLGMNNLSGNIPSEIWTMTSLQQLWLYKNQFTGSIPPEIGNLTNLEHLNFWTNQLTGTIPPEVGNLTNLLSLSFGSNQLTGIIPTQIGNLVNLTGRLNFSDNPLSGGIPKEIGDLTGVTKLDIYGSQLTGSIPTELGNLTNLDELLLYDNNFTGSLPTGIANMANLVDFQIHKNKFDAIPNISGLSNLTTTRIDSNSFTFEDIEPNVGITGISYSPQESIGVEIDSLVVDGANLLFDSNVGGANNVYQWYKDGTSVTGQASSSLTINGFSTSDAGSYSAHVTNTLVTGLTIYTRPINLSVNYSVFTMQDSLALVALYNSTDGANWINNTNWKTNEPLSSWFGVTVSSGRVTELDLRTNNLIGTIPTEIGNLTNLTTLYMDRNQLSGSIPSEIGNLTKMTILDLGYNQLIGGIPSAIGSLTYLESLSLRENWSLSGTIPPEIWQVTSLFNLDLAGCNLSGTISVDIGNLTNLTNIDFQSNQLTGNLPAEIGDLTNLIMLLVSQNQLSGDIPAEFYTLSNLRTMWFNHNQFTGSIPPEINQLTSIEYFNVGYNQMTGSIPAEIGSLSNLNTLYIHQNQFSGIIPPEIGSLSNLTNMSFWNNQLTGTIPVEMFNLTNLQSFSVGNNQLTGSIPTQVANLVNLSDRLNFSNNLFTGSIPSVIGNLTGVQKLHLNGNQYTGSVPTELGNLINLTELYMQSSNLSGSIPAGFANMANLTILEIQDNNFDAIPDISGLANLATTRIDSNAFTFEDIEPNVNITGITYNPQDSTGTTIDVVAVLNSAYIDTIHVGGSANLYQWYKDGTILTGETDSILSVANFSQSDIGAYTAHVSNTIVTGLTIYRTININAASGVLAMDSTAAAGSILSIPILASSDLTGKGVYSYQFEFIFDPAVLKFISIDVANSDITNGNNVTINSNESSAGVLKVAVSSATELSGSGNLLNINFGVSSAATLGTTSSYSFNNFLFNEGDVNVVTIGGTATISLLLGDVTENGAVTADDAVFVLQECVGKITLNDNQYSVGDVTGNGTLSALDASYILQKDVGNISEFPSNTQFPKAVNFDVGNHNLEIIEEKGFILLKLRGGIESNVYSIEGSLDFENSGLEFVDVASEKHLIQSAIENNSLQFAIAGSDELTENISEFRFKKSDNFDIKKLKINNLSVNEQVVDDGAISVLSNMLPTEYALNSNYPNPFNPTTTISFSIPIASKVELSVYNASGQLVKTIVSASFEQGVHEAKWNGKNSSGQKVASGVYIYRLRAGSFTATQKMVLIK